MVPGDFVKTYEVGGPGFRRFDALVTCFFIDTPKDIEELFRVMDGLLDVGGVWVNLGPLNWRKEARLKLAWEEIARALATSCAFDARGISTLIYAWGKMRYKSKLLMPFCIIWRKRLKDFDPQSIANMVFGIGILGLKFESRLLDAVGREVPSRLQEFRLEEVISIARTLA
eukprot:g1255.t1